VTCSNLVLMFMLRAMVKISVLVTDSNQGISFPGAQSRSPRHQTREESDPSLISPSWVSRMASSAPLAFASALIFAPRSSSGPLTLRSILGSGSGYVHRVTGPCCSGAGQITMLRVGVLFMVLTSSLGKSLPVLGSSCQALL